MADSSLAVDFWLDVERQLQVEFGMPVERASRLLMPTGVAWRVWGPSMRFTTGARDIAQAIHGGRYSEEPARS